MNNRMNNHSFSFLSKRHCLVNFNVKNKKELSESVVKRYCRENKQKSTKYLRMGRFNSLHTKCLDRRERGAKSFNCFSRFYFLNAIHDFSQH